MGAKDFILIALGLLVSTLLVTITFKVIKPSTESIGTNLTAMQDSMVQMNQTEFNDYDQKTLKGSEVQSAVKLYQDRDYAICIETIGSGTSYNNYCALVEGTSASSNSKEAPKANGVTDADFKENQLTVEGLAEDDNGVLRNKNIKNINNKNSKTEYVRPTANFDARLIRNTNGEIVGIAFKQQPNQDGKKQ